MNSFLDLVCDQLNLSWAWEKVKKSSVPGDIWINELELSDFEINLAENFKKIQSELRSCVYRVRPLRPMAFPKNPSSNGESRVRQYFNFSIMDQVVWVAVVNIIGPYLDLKMPNWSYGNRLFRSTWIEDNDTSYGLRKIGPYRNSSGRIYRPFPQTWPVFRRHIMLSFFAARKTENYFENLDSDDQQELTFQKSLNSGLRCPYLVPEYWSGSGNEENTENVYWASVDLEKFYPSISLSACKEAIISNIPKSMTVEAENVLDMLTKFEIDITGWREDQLSSIELNTSDKYFYQVPTGLLVSGFLANAAMLKVDHSVEKNIRRGRVAHFRYVDDHVILAKSFDDLTEWLECYKTILKKIGPGPQINTLKTEPKELGEFLASLDNDDAVMMNADLREKAKKSTRLDSDFPTPLITKTIALVSAIGKTDFTGLEDNELGILSQQLEQLLLVDLPESEMPERTRLAFAATRLARVAETRMSSPNVFYAEKALIEDTSTKHRDLFKDPIRSDDFLAKLTGIQDRNTRANLASASNRVFILLRRVLQKKPDRVRLWTNALVIARRLGVGGIDKLFLDIESYSNDPVNLLAAEYILGNSYAVLGAQVIIATQLLVDFEITGWRRAAALRFLQNFSDLKLLQLETRRKMWFVEYSYNQLCVGLYCSYWLLNNREMDCENYGLNFENFLISRGFELLSSDILSPRDRVALAWWACKFELRQPVRKAPLLISHIMSLVGSLSEAEDLWIFFPQDIPMNILVKMGKNQSKKENSLKRDGWWVDALKSRAYVDYMNISIPPISRIKGIIAHQESSASLSLPAWAELVWSRISQHVDEEWKIGEWTCLEIVRQAAQLINSDRDFDENYLDNIKNENDNICAHPFNFTLPRKLAEVTALSWEEWRNCLRVKGGVVKFCPKKNIINDSRYAPLMLGPIGTEQNSIRGLGLCLLGLLSKSFSLPVQWNGPGHESLLSHLSQLLRNEISYSSATLGVLEACLRPRVAENVMANFYNLWTGEFDDDTSQDPVTLLNASELATIIKIAQEELERNQMSTLDHRLRQVTPVNLMHLTDTDWKAYFGMKDL